MRKIRILSLVLLISSALVFGFYRLYQWKNRDSVGPQITMEPQRLEVSTKATEEELLQGITAHDIKDGDVTGSLVIEQFSNFIDKGRREITVAAFDSDNHISKMKREIVYTDYAAPQFSVKSCLRFPLESKDILSCFSANDCLDGDISSRIQMSSDYQVVLDRAGEYPAVFSVTNSAGDVATLKVTIEIYDPREENLCPQITLSEYLISVDVGGSIDPWDYVKSIRSGGRDFTRGEDGVLYNHDSNAASAQLRSTISRSEVQMEGDVDYNTPGSYEILYTFRQSEEEKTGRVRLIVVVNEQGGSDVAE